jgi:monofunctional biosynthetic peptidoglycan transglycosylase
MKKRTKINKKSKIKFKYLLKQISKKKLKKSYNNKKKSKHFFIFLKNTFFAIIGFHLFLFSLFFFLSINIIFINPKFTTLMVYRNIVDKQQNKKIIFIPIKNISKRIQTNIIGIEDFKFYKHIGIDPEAINRAYNINKRLGYKYSGGSTITQQLTRTMFLIPNKNYLRKYFELLIALEIDLILTKKRILELYLNYIEFGNGIYGIGRASYYYYNKSFYKLNNDEINKLITIIPNPKKYNPYNFYINKKLLKRYNRLSSWSL